MYSHKVIGIGFGVLLFATPLISLGQSQQSCIRLTTNLSVGSRGSDVIQLQQYLIFRNLLSADFATGYFGRLTEAAVQQWQSSHGVVSSGSPASTGHGAVGPKTRTALASACSGSSTTSSTTNSVQRTIDALLAQVTALQETIRALNSVKTVTTTSSPSCFFNGQNIANGHRVLAYESSSGQTCLLQNRTCTNGVLSGSYQYASCSISVAPSTFSAGPTSGSAPLAVYFKVNNTGEGYSVGFGDGSIGSNWNMEVESGVSWISHTYTYAGTYKANQLKGSKCAISNDAGYRCSGGMPQIIGTATITVAPSSTGPIVSTTFSDISLDAGSTYVWSVTAGGVLPLAYQWQKQNASGGWDDLPSANDSRFGITNILQANAGVYRVRVTGGDGGVSYGNPFRVAVN